MDTISPRILRAEADSLACRPRTLTPREIERETKILDTAEALLARHGANRITFSNLILALRLSRGTMRFHFVDRDDLLGALLRRHLETLSEILDGIKGESPQAFAARRAAWHRATRTASGAPTNAHTLLIRDREHLPEDLRDNIETLYRALVARLSVPQTPALIALFEAPQTSLADIERALTAKPSPTAGPLTQAA